MSVDCQKPRPSGEPCGVLAVGRCGVCQDAVCVSHRFISATGFVLVDRCAACVEAAAVAERQQQNAERARLDQLGQLAQNAERSLNWRAAQIARALVSAGSPGLQRRSLKYPDPRWYNQSRMAEEQLPSGWPLGAHRWRFTRRDPNISMSEPVWENVTQTLRFEIFLLEDGRLAHESLGGGRDDGLDPSAYEEVLDEIEELAKRHGVSTPWDIGYSDKLHDL